MNKFSVILLAAITCLSQSAYADCHYMKKMEIIFTILIVMAMFMIFIRLVEDLLVWLWLA